MLENHLELCQNHDHQRHVYPNQENKYIFFKQYQKLHRVPFLKKSERGPPNTKNTCRVITAIQLNVWTRLYKNKTVLYTMQEEGEDIGRKFVEPLEQDLKEVYKILKTVIPIKMLEEEEASFNAATACYACGLRLGPLPSHSSTGEQLITNVILG